MAFRVVKQDFWTDEKVVDNFSVEDKYFFLYLLTNPHSNQLGVYKLPLKFASFECGYSKEQVIVLLDRFQNVLDLIRYNQNTQEIAIGNFLYHSIVSGGTPVMNTVKKDMVSVKDKELLKYIIDKSLNKTITNKTVLDILNNIKEYINYTSNNNDNGNGDTGTDTQYDTGTDTEKIPFKEVVEYLNNKAGKNYKYSTESNKKHIRARFNEGFTLEDFKTVIDSKVLEWKDNDKMRIYLRPETLFGTKFESYLNSAPTRTDKKEPLPFEPEEVEEEMSYEDFVKMMESDD